MGKKKQQNCLGSKVLANRKASDEVFYQLNSNAVSTHKIVLNKDQTNLESSNTQRLDPVYQEDQDFDQMSQFCNSSEQPHYCQSLKEYSAPCDIINLREQQDNFCQFPTIQAPEQEPIEFVPNCVKINHFQEEEGNKLGYLMSPGQEFHELMKDQKIKKKSRVMGKKQVCGKQICQRVGNLIEVCLNRKLADRSSKNHISLQDLTKIFQKCEDRPEIADIFLNGDYMSLLLVAKKKMSVKNQSRNNSQRNLIKTLNHVMAEFIQGICSNNLSLAFGFDVGMSFQKRQGWNQGKVQEKQKNKRKKLKRKIIKKANRFIKVVKQNDQK